VVLAAAALAAPAAMAGNGDVRKQGTCTGATSIELKLGNEDGRVEVELEVDANRRGSKWTVRIRRNGTLVFAGQRKTRGRSGSFTVRRVVSASGQSRFTARATGPSGEVCRVSATFTPSAATDDNGGGADDTGPDDNGGGGGTTGGDDNGGATTGATTGGGGMPAPGGTPAPGGGYGGGYGGGGYGPGY
jgi:hypothetical protein